MSRQTRSKSWQDDQSDELRLPPAFIQRLNSQNLTYRWLRYLEGSDKQDRRLLGRFQEGWRFVTTKEIPEWETPPTGTGRYADNIVVGDLILAVCDTNKVKERRERIQQRAEEMATAFRQNLLRTSDSKYPITDSSKISTTGGRKVNFDE